MCVRDLPAGSDPSSPDDGLAVGCSARAGGQRNGKGPSFSLCWLLVPSLRGRSERSGLRACCPNRFQLRTDRDGKGVALLCQGNAPVCSCLPSESRGRDPV